MKYSSKLTKRFYFPIVEGSNVGAVLKANKMFSAFTTYIDNPLGGLTKVTNFSQMWHWFASAKIIWRHGFHFSWFEEGRKMVKTIHKSNLYLNRQYCRLEKYLKTGETEKYFKLAELLEKRSKLFALVIMVRRTHQRWTEMGLARVISILKTRSLILTKEKVSARYKRVFLKETKPDGSFKKWRPLGVPELEWRMVSATKEFFLVNFLAPKWYHNQFAGLPGKGPADAWIEILRWVSGADRPKAQRIVGYDLAKFFDTVQVNYVYDALQNAGVPTKYNEWFIRFNKSPAKILPQDAQKERERITKTHLESPRSWWKFKGLPQGMNTSPILACWALQATMLYGSMNKDSTIVQYVDDGLIINGPNGAREELPSLMRWTERALYSGHSGLAFNEEKTEVIMVEEKFLKPLKFLGCMYDGKTFKAATRRSGVYEVKNASEKIEQIIEWLKENGNQLADYRRELSLLIAAGWNPDANIWTTVPKIKGTFLGGLTGQFSTWWNGTLTKTTRLKESSVEVLSYRRFASSLMPFFAASNCSTMVCSYYLLSVLKENTTLKKPGKLSRRRSAPLMQTQLLDW